MRVYGFDYLVGGGFKLSGNNQLRNHLGHIRSNHMCSQKLPVGSIKNKLYKSLL